jgi:hypothetical protein
MANERPPELSGGQSIREILLLSPFSERRGKTGAYLQEEVTLSFIASRPAAFFASSAVAAAT